MKTCCRCNLSKEFSDFGKVSASPDGLRAACNVCIRAAVKASRSKNPQRFRDYNRKSKFKSPENMAKVLARTRKWKLEHPEAVRKHDREKYNRHSAKMDKKSRKYAREHPEQVRETKRKSMRKAKLERPDVLQDRYLQRTYGISLEQFDERILNQGGCCAICDREAKLCVDHCHKTKTVRGLLCGNCNRAIGLLFDSPASARKMVRYLS